MLRSLTADISAEWLAGSARIKITLDRPVVMSGYARRTDPFKSIAHDLWAKALVLKDSTCSRFAVITTDVSGIQVDLAAEIYRLEESDLSLVRGPLKSVRSETSLTLQKPRSISELEPIPNSGFNWLKHNSRVMLDTLRAGKPLPDRFDAPASVWQFGSDLTLIGHLWRGGKALRTYHAKRHRPSESLDRLLLPRLLR